MKSSTSKGNYWKLKTKKWFEKDGYYCELLEKTFRVFVKNKVIFVKRDILASDGVAVRNDQIIFWQCKLNKKNVAAAIREFKKIPFPKFVNLWVVVWTPGAREPEIIEVGGDQKLTSDLKTQTAANEER